MTNPDYRPEAVLDQAAESDEGVVVRFATISARNSFRTRLYKAMERVKTGSPDPGAWDDLVLRSVNAAEGASLWIGPPAAVFEITGMEKAK